MSPFLPKTSFRDPFLDHYAFTVAQTVQDVAFVGRLVWPGVETPASDLVLLELTVVDGAIGPLEDTTAPEQTVTQLALVLMPILKLARTVTVIDLADLRSRFKLSKVSNLLRTSSQSTGLRV